MSRPRGPSEPEAPAPAPPAAEASPKRDVVLVGPPTPDGSGFHVLRARDERLEAGELRALQEGRPIVGEVVTLRPREENPRICDVEASFEPPRAASARPTTKGPAQVATDRYRDRWDEIFARKPEPDSRSLN